MNGASLGLAIDDALSAVPWELIVECFVSELEELFLLFSAWQVVSGGF